MNQVLAMSNSYLNCSICSHSFINPSKNKLKSYIYALEVVDIHCKATLSVVILSKEYESYISLIYKFTGSQLLSHKKPYYMFSFSRKNS